MSDKPENPPAFPRLGEGFGSPKYDEPGMSLLDYFAGQALAGMLASADNDAKFVMALREAPHAAYKIADAMLLARKESQP